MRFNLNKEPIGEGGEKKVYDDPNNPNRVVGVYRENRRDKTLNQVKGRYYMQKILHLLFPKNIPDIHESTQSHVIIEKKERDSDHLAFQELRMARSLAREKGDFSSSSQEMLAAHEAMENKRSSGVDNLIRKLMRIGILFDSNIVNFATDSQGVITYLDTFDPWNISRHGEKYTLYPQYEKEELLQAINKLEDPEKSQALKFFSRLNELQEKDTLLLNKSN